MCQFFKSKCSQNNSKKLVVVKIKDETAGVAVEEFAVLNPEMYSYLVKDNSEHEKAKCVDRHFVATISRNEYKDVLLNKKYLRRSMKIYKDHEIGTFELNKVSLCCFDDKK